MGKDRDYGDRIDRIKDQDKEYERDKAIREQKISREKFVSDASRRLVNNVEALKVLHGLDCENIVRSVSARLPQSALTIGNIEMFVNVFKIIGKNRSQSLHKALVAIEADPLPSNEDKAFLCGLWIASTIKKEIDVLTDIIETSDDTSDFPVARAERNFLRTCYDVYFEGSEKILKEQNKRLAQLIKDKDS